MENNENKDTTLENTNNENTNVNENIDNTTNDNNTDINETKNIEENKTNNENQQLKKNEIKLLTYNIFMRPPPVHSLDSDYKTKRLSAISKEIFPKFDIIAFQECFGFASNRIKIVKKKAIENGLKYISYSKKKHVYDFGIDGGLCLLSRYPVEYEKQIFFKNGCHSDAYAAKGALYNKIKLGENYLHIFTSHTQASYEHSPNIDSKSVQVRFSQFTEIRKFIEEMTENSSPSDIILLVGDLNVNGRYNQNDGKKSSEEYNLMLRILKGNVSIYKKEKIFIREEYEEGVFDVEDAVYNKFEEHPTTSCNLFRDDYYKDEKQKKTNKSLDYIFRLRKLKNKDNNNEDIKLENVEIQEFIDNNNQTYLHLSDHYGVSAKIITK